ncbi:MAG: hypothetical protein H6577_00790 [Lewinellaceae bacterium]|nr:hypothetical protein [Saprospiraceae bacterium]MCB9336644.1 hypothetical protein [Lewinellaceae bacterium]
MKTLRHLPTAARIRHGEWNGLPEGQISQKRHGGMTSFQPHQDVVGRVKYKAHLCTTQRPNENASSPKPTIMKDNVFKILSIILLLLGLGVSARIIRQNDSVNLDQNPIIADPHNPALGGDATLAIPPSDRKALSFVKHEAADSRNLQFPENHKINTGLLLNLQAGC